MSNLKEERLPDWLLARGWLLTAFHKLTWDEQSKFLIPTGDNEHDSKIHSVIMKALDSLHEENDAEEALLERLREYANRRWPLP